MVLSGTGRTSMTANRLIFGIMLIMLFTMTSHSHARMVHDFDCAFCHEAFTSEDVPYMTYNVCLDCHYPGEEGTTYLISDGSTSNPITATFAAGDGSNAMGSNAAPGAQTSHFFAGSTDGQPAAGATPPSDWRFNIGWAKGLVTCSRCHNPHGDTSNPKLLKLRAGKTDAMCLACHKDWNQQGNHGRGTHPMHADYPALATAKPEKFKAVPDNFGTSGDISLVDDVKVSCTSCHGVHWVDSDASTPDGKIHASAAELNPGDGKLLKFDGPAREKPDQSLCQTCHTYDQHGRESGLGCMVCHGGHAYDPDGVPNYYILKKQVSLDAVPKTSGEAGTVNLDYTDFPSSFDLNGICQECHILSDSHIDGYACSDCHQHKTGFTHVSGSGGYDCETCHAPDHVVKSDQANWVTIFDNTASHSSEIGSNNPGPIYVYATCSLCHTTNLLTQHANDCHKCHAGTSPPAEGFGGAPWNQTCQQGSCHATYHADASDLHDDYYWNARDTDYGDCNNCHHGSGFDVPWPWDISLPGYVATASDCGMCHTMGSDSVAPVSHSDLQSAYFGTAVINIWATDARAIKAFYYRLDEGPIQTLSGGQLVIAPPESGVQTHILEYWARDWTGNTETPHKSGSFTVTEDTVPPVTTSDAKSIYGGTATIQLSATDNATSFGVAATYYQFDDGEVFTGTTAVMPEPASGSEEHTLSFWSVDHVGNVEAKNHVIFTIIKDEVAPSTTSNLQPEPHYYSRANLRNGTHLDIALTSVDPEPASGVAGIQVSSSNIWMKYESDNEADWNGSAWEIAVYFNGDGYFPISYAARDHSGNVEAAKTTTIAVDRGRPDTESDAVPEYSGTATIFLTATDNFSGVDTIYYQIDNTGPEQVYNASTGIVIPPPASGSAEYTIFYWAVDVAGNIEYKYNNHAYDKNRDTITIWEEGTDIAPPTGSVSINDGDAWTNNAAVILTLDASDADGTLTDMQFSNDGITWSGWEPYAASKDWTFAGGAGTKTVYVQFRDDSPDQHVSATYSDSIGLETTPPTTSNNAVGGKTYFGEDFSGSRTFTLSPSDTGGSGIESTWWKLDLDGPWTEGTSVTVPVPATGTENHTIYWYSIDHAGNQEAQQSVSFTMEAGGLEHTGLMMDQQVAFYAYEGASSPWIQYKIFIDDDSIPEATITKNQYSTVTTWDCPGYDLNSVRQIKIQVNAWFDNYLEGSGGGNVPYTYTYTLPEGATRLEPATWSGFPQLAWNDYEMDPDNTSSDFSWVGPVPGMIENVIYVTTNPDTTTPATTSNVVSGAVYVGNQTFALSPADPGGSGVENTWWKLDSGNWTQGTAPSVSAPSSGTAARTLYWYSQDHAGNQEPVKSVSFSVETFGTETLSLNMSEHLGYNATEYATDPWATYTISVDDQHVITRGAYSSRDPSDTFNISFPETDISSGGHIDITVDAGFHGLHTLYDKNVPHTYTITLPGGSKRLEAVNWKGFKKFTWNDHAFWEDGNDDGYYSYVSIQPGTIINIVYATTGTDSTAPATTIDAVEGATYTGDQTFTLSATDADSGVESTWWQFDNSGIWNIGTSVPVAAPESGTAAHTITWYSRDHATNQEVYQSVNFEVGAAEGG